jgi:uncharacterized protein (TIGR00369 family)
MEVSEAPFAPNPNGAVHGGIVSAMIDHVMGVTLLSALPARNAAVTATLTVNFLEPAIVPLTLGTHITRASRALMFAECEVFSGDRVVDRATGTFVPRENFLLDPADAAEGVAFYALGHPVIPRTDS